MKSTTTRSRILGAAGAVLVASLLMVPQAAAHPGKGHGNGHGKPAKHERHVKVKRHVVHEHHVAPRPYRYGHDYRVIPAPRARFTVPARLGVRVADYGPYYQGAVWYAPHRHTHRAYEFPVFVDGRWIARPYFYCGDQRFDSFHASWRGPSISVDLRF